VSVRNPGIVDPPKLIAVDSAAPEGSKDVDVTVAGTVSAVAHGLARPQAHDLQTHADFGSQVAELSVDVPAGTPLLSAQIPADLPGEWQNVFIVRDLDGDGRADETEPDVGERVQEGNFLRSDAIEPEPGKYVIFVRIDALDQPITVRTSTWLVDDPHPDDPEPAPGLVAGGDPFQVYPGDKRTVHLSWNGVDGDQPLRGVVAWRGSGDAELATSVVDVNPGTQ
jgi:hypothetical protein